MGFRYSGPLWGSRWPSTGTPDPSFVCAVDGEAAGELMSCSHDRESSSTIALALEGWSMPLAGSNARHRTLHHRENVSAQSMLRGWGAGEGMHQIQDTAMKLPIIHKTTRQPSRIT